MEPRDYLLAIRAHESNLTQAQIAQRTGIPQPTISKIERGEVEDVMSRSYRALQALYEELTGAPGSELATTMHAVATTAGGECSRA